MKRFFILTMLMSIMLPSVAQRATKSKLTEESIYYAAFADVLRDANDLTSGAEMAYYYAIEDLDKDGVTK